VTRRDARVFRTGMKACKGKGPYVPPYPRRFLLREDLCNEDESMVREGKFEREGAPW
jgi:hypothetical protein